MNALPSRTDSRAVELPPRRTPGSLLSWPNLFFGLLLLIPSAWATSKLRHFDGFVRLESWHVSDYLIHYGSGFVRRGLFGSLLLALEDAGVRTSPSVLALGLTLASLWVVAVSLATTALKLRRMNAVLIAFSPVLLPVFYALDPAGGGRKDSLALLLLSGSLCLFEVLRGRWRVLVMRLILLILLPVLILCHEGGIFFIALVLCCLCLLSGEEERPGRDLRSGLLILPALLLPTLACLAVIAFLPDPSWGQLTDMCQEWAGRGYGLRCNPVPDYMFALVANDEHRAWALRAFVSPGFYVSLLVTVSYLVLMLRGPLLDLSLAQHRSDPAGEPAQAASDPGRSAAVAVEPQPRIEARPAAPGRSVPAARSTLIAVTLIAFVPSLPVYVLACDFGRWLSLAFTVLVLQLCSRRYLLALGRALQPLRAPLLRIDRLLPVIAPSQARLLLALITPFLFLPHWSNPPLLLTLRGPASWLLP